jgi:hypothetical protein
MRVLITLAFAAIAAASLEIVGEQLKTASKMGWTTTGTDTFTLNEGKSTDEAYHKNWAGGLAFVGSSTGGGLCPAPGNSHLEAKVTMLEADPVAVGGTLTSGKTKTRMGLLDQVKDNGQYASIAMRADHATGDLGYRCQIDAMSIGAADGKTRGLNAITLTRSGETVLGCPKIDNTNGVMRQWTTGFNKDVAGPYTYREVCQIRDRGSLELFEKGQEYVMRMDLVEDADLGTVTVTCSIDGVQKLTFADPCPLKGGDYGLGSKYESKLQVTSYTELLCDNVPTPAALVPSLADGLTLAGMGRTAAYWASKDLASTNTVAHRYAGGCNNGAYKNGASVHPGGAGFNREGGGRSNDAINVAALSSGTCVKDGFFEADVAFRGDFMGIGNGYGKVSAEDTHVTQDQRLGFAGIAMRVDATDNGQRTSNQYNSFGYMCQISAKNGQVAVYRGRNGGTHGKDNTIGAAYLSGTYRCSQCTCSDGDAPCSQFDLPIDPRSKHTLRLEVTTDSDDNPVIECSLNGTVIVSNVDKRQGRHNWFPGDAKSLGPGVGTKSCGDFGLLTADTDIVEYTVKDYTGFVAPTASPTGAPTEAPTEETPTEAATTALTVQISSAIGGITVDQFSKNAAQKAYKQTLAQGLGTTPEYIAISNIKAIATGERRRLSTTPTGVTFDVDVTVGKESDVTAPEVANTLGEYMEDAKLQKQFKSKLLKKLKAKQIVVDETQYEAFDMATETTMNFKQAEDLLLAGAIAKAVAEEDGCGMRCCKGTWGTAGSAHKNARAGPHVCTVSEGAKLQVLHKPNTVMHDAHRCYADETHANGCRCECGFYAEQD